MPFDRDDLQTIITRTTADLTSRWTGTYNRLRRAVLVVIARVLAGLANGLYGYLDWIADQILPDKMETDRLRRFGAIFGVPYSDAEIAAGTIDVTGNDDTIIPAGTLWQRDADAVEYESTAEAVIAAGVATITVQAIDAGAAGNADADTAITIVEPISGLTPEATVSAGGITGGADAVDIDTTYRSLVLDRTSTFFTGANSAVYKKWALEVDGVTRAWVYENTPAAGSVTILFVCDDQSGSIIPDASMITAVTDYLNEHTDPITGQTVGRCVNVTLVVNGPTAQPIDFQILPFPNTASVQAAIQAELEDMLRRDAEPGTPILISHIREAISAAAGENDYNLATPTANVDVASGNIATMGTFTWA